jgi:hypothetical protein
LLARADHGLIAIEASLARLPGISGGQQTQPYRRPNVRSVSAMLGLQTDTDAWAKGSSYVPFGSAN